MRILFTCLGNICRSPIAEAVLKQKIKTRNLDWEIASNGTNRYHKGGPADPRTVKVCARNGIDITTHIAKRFQTNDFSKYDLIVCMAEEVYGELQEFVTDRPQLDNVIVQEFDDPWYGGDEGFEICFRQIEIYCDGLIKKYL